MGPRVQFCRRNDGGRLAFTVNGEGPLMVFPAWWVSHLERDWDEPRFRAFFSELGEHFTVVRYDRSGVGLSDRERSDFTLEREVADLEALLDHLGYDRVTLVGTSCGGPVAVACAARRPKQIEKLILYGSYASGDCIWDPELKDAMLGLVRAHWGIGAKAITDIFAPDLTLEESRRLARMQRDAASPEVAAELLDLTYRMDVRHWLSGLELPTLVIHRRDETAIATECSRDLAAEIRGATLVLLEGQAHAPWFGDSAPVIDAIVEFMGDDGRPASPARTRRSGNVWRRDGDVWTIRFAEQEIHLKHQKGLADLAALLAHPGHELHALELVRGPGSACRRTSAQPVLDERARAEYRERLGTLEAELAEAEANRDLGRTRKLRAERDAVLAELAHATGLDGRTRPLKDPAERARKAVAARIRHSIAKVEQAHPQLGAHLRDSVGTGVFCEYSPRSDTLWST